MTKGTDCSAELSSVSTNASLLKHDREKTTIAIMGIWERERVM